MMGTNLRRLKVMTQEELLEAYAEFSRVHGESIETGNYKAANKAHDQLYKVHQRMKEIGVDSTEQMRDLMGSGSPGTRLWAAAHCLSFAPKEAERVLTELSSVPRSLVGFSAGTTLEEWRKGTLKL